MTSAHISNKAEAQAVSEQEKAFTQYSVPRVLLKFIIPSVLSQLTVLIFNLADAFFVGRTGDTFQISAMAITFPVMMTISCVGTIFGVGANAHMAAELGKGNREPGQNLFCVRAVYGQRRVHPPVPDPAGDQRTAFIRYRRG